MILIPTEETQIQPTTDLIILLETTLEIRLRELRLPDHQHQRERILLLLQDLLAHQEVEEAAAEDDHQEVAEEGNTLFYTYCLCLNTLVA